MVQLYHINKQLEGDEVMIRIFSTIILSLSLLVNTAFCESPKLPNANKPSATELKDNRGRDKLGEIDPDSLGLNENDLKMIDRFVGKGN